VLYITRRHVLKVGTPASRFSSTRYILEHNLQNQKTCIEAGRHTHKLKLHILLSRPERDILTQAGSHQQDIYWSI